MSITLCAKALYYSQKVAEQSAAAEATRKYVDELINHPETVNLQTQMELKRLLTGLHFEILEPLYFALKNIFTPEICNEYRIVIIQCFFSCSEADWPKLVQCINFIMPPGTRGHDVMCATEALTSFRTPQWREKVVHIANRLLRYDTSTVERGYILRALLNMTKEELEQLDASNEEVRCQFVKEVTPPLVIKNRPFFYAKIVRALFSKSTQELKQLDGNKEACRLFAQEVASITEIEIELGYILRALLGKTQEELEQLDVSSEEVRCQFVKKATSSLVIKNRPVYYAKIMRALISKSTQEWKQLDGDEEARRRLMQEVFSSSEAKNEEISSACDLVLEKAIKV